MIFRFKTMISIDFLQFSEIKDLEASVRQQKLWNLTIPSTSKLHELDLTVTPQEGIYKGGVFKFKITVPPEYNNSVRK